MDDSNLDTSRSFIADVYLEVDDARHPLRINDSGWLQILKPQINGHPILPTTLWFGCYEVDGEAFYVIKEYTKGGSKNGDTLGISDDGQLGFYASSSPRQWHIGRRDGEALVPRSTPEAPFTVATKGGRRWTAHGKDCMAAKGTDSAFLVHIHKIGVYRF
ncbi:hypothetical protein CCOS865_01584 [Pseudomonas reidholzensis]|uniref:Uncharacterized protein n=1 Tax=Pseudomonas reidholzensis TaxID=1785162 RepID=A0A383RRD9_9PSED|nr:hypothetical protein [Pseudomonas reidholzensis]SYX89333.1 hypothetical protein CCOS865_01584 [Pseudomonas reidholzensis]